MRNLGEEVGLELYNIGMVCSYAAVLEKTEDAPLVLLAIICSLMIYT